MKELSLPNPFSAPVFYKDSTGSTMDDAQDLWTGGYPSGTVIWAGHQSQGRGRFSDRCWIDTPGESLLFTHIADQKDPLLQTLGPVSLLWAAALARLLRTQGLDAWVKWPNDVLIRGQKAIGILVQGRKGAFLTGIGINRAQKTFPFDTRIPATSLDLEGWSIDSSDLLILALESFYQELRRDETMPKRLGPLLAFINEPVSLQTYEQGTLCRVEGILEGIGTSGEALVRTPSGLRGVYSGE